MIFIKEQSLNKTWKKTVKELLENGYTPQDNRFIKMESIVIEIDDPKIEDIDKYFPMTQEDINIINNYIITGENEENVCHEWTKLYYHRLFDEPDSQITYIINRIKNGKAGIASNWIKQDQNSKIKPCMMSITANNENGKLFFNLHARACDIYNKLLMNLQEFITLQYYIAEKTNFEVGRFTMFIDYAQILREDEEKVRKIIKQKQ